jgi:ribonuclease Z
VVARREPTLADIVAETRQAYDGPLEVGEDLMSFEIGDTVTSRCFKPRPTRPPIRRS